MRKSLFRIGSVIALTAGVIWACGHGAHGPTSQDSEPVPGSVSSSPAPVAPPAQQGPGSGICLNKPMFQSADGSLKMCVLESNLILDADRCQTVVPGTTYRHKVGIISISAGYFRSAGFRSTENNCAATGDSPFTDPNNQKTFPAGESSYTFEWSFEKNFCGRQQRDARAVNLTDTLVGVTSFVFNAPAACPSCTAANVISNLKQNGRTVSVTPTFVGKGTIDVDFGDGPLVPNNKSGDTISHTYPDVKKTYSIHFILHLDSGLECDPEEKVSVEPMPPSCGQFQATLGVVVGSSSVSAGARAAAVPTINATASGTFNFSGCTFAWGDASPPESLTVSPFSKSKAFAQTGVQQDYTAQLQCTVPNSQVSCSVSKPFTIPPRQSTCSDYQPPATTVTLGTPVTSQTASDFTVTSIPVTQDAGVTGVFVPALPKTVSRPSAGSSPGTVHFDYNWTRTYSPAEGLQCTTTGTVPKDVSVPPKNDSCDNYEKPIIVGDIASDVQTTQVVFSSGTVAPGGGTFNPALPQTVARPNANQPAGSFATTYTLVYGPQNLQCSVNKSFTKSVPPKGDSCSNYEPPAITGSPHVTTTATQVTVDAGTVAPGGGVFTPSLPLSVTRPDYGQPATAWNTDYTKSYGPENLHCLVSKHFTGPVGPKDPTCEQQNPPSASFGGFTDSGGNLSGSVSLHNAGGWTVSMFATSTESRCNAGQSDYEKVRHTDTVACGGSATDTVSYHWSGHPSEWWWVAWSNSGTPSAGGRSQCIRNTHN